MYWCSYYVVPANESIEIKIPSCKTMFVTASGNCTLRDLYRQISTVVLNNAFIKIPIVGVYSPATLIAKNGTNNAVTINIFYIENGGIPDDEKYRELWGG